MVGIGNILDSRLAGRPGGWLDIRADLRHLAFVTYAVPKAGLENYVPKDRFKILEFPIGGAPRALVSAVNLSYAGFRFVRFPLYVRSRVFQTNYRAYILDRAGGEYAVWFLGGTVGSRLARPGRMLWGLPWRRAHYSADCAYAPREGRYETYSVMIESEGCAADIRLVDTGEPVSLCEGFSSLDEMRLILTHPAKGFYRRPDGAVGRLSVWHEELSCTEASPERLSFAFFKECGLLTGEEMKRPHSVLICPESTFEIAFPPLKEKGDSRVRNSRNPGTRREM